MLLLFYFLANVTIHGGHANDVDNYDSAGGNMHDVRDTDNYYHCKSDANKYLIKFYDWSKADWTSLNHCIASFDWSLCFCSGQTCDEFIGCFYSVLDQAIKNFVPAKSKISKSQLRKKKFYPKPIRKKLALKAKLWRKYRNKKTLSSKIKYGKVAESCKGMLHMHQAALEKKVLSGNDLGKFYRYINSKLSCKSGIAPLTNSDGNYIFDNDIKANLLNDYFASVCVTDNGAMPELQPQSITDKLSDISFTPDRLYNIMRKLKNSMASGPDGFPPDFFKKLASCLADPLCMLFKYIFKSKKYLSGPPPCAW
jgi:hypothetical protein